MPRSSSAFAARVDDDQRRREHGERACFAAIAIPRREAGIAPVIRRLQEDSAGGTVPASGGIAPGLGGGEIDDACGRNDSGHGDDSSSKDGVPSFFWRTAGKLVSL